MGALHQVDFASLRSAAIRWHDVFANVPRPLLVVNIGGPTSNFYYTYLFGPLYIPKSCILLIISCGLLVFKFQYLLL